MDGPPGRVAPLLLAALILLSLPAATVGATPGSLFGVQAVDPDQVHLRADIQPDGDAEWRIEYRVRLDSENETEAFEDLMADVEENESAYLVDFQDRINSTVDAAENSTGREMAAVNYDVSARITQLPQEYGVLTYTFTWENFATTDGDRLVAGDALAGFFLDSETTLVIGWPEDYREVEVTPAPSDRQSNAVVWRGQLDFGAGEPRVIVEPEPAGGTTQTTTNGGAATTSPGGEQAAPDVGTVAIIAIVAMALGAAILLYLRRRSLPEGLPTSVTTESESEPTPPPEAASTAAEPEAQEPPSELLSNEERVVKFLEQEGGRAKQQEIVDGLGWTDAKTSQVLSGMAEEGQIEKFRIGRENVVKLPDDEDNEGINV